MSEEGIDPRHWSADKREEVRRNEADGIQKVRAAIQVAKMERAKRVEQIRTELERIAADMIGLQDRRKALMKELRRIR